MTESPELDVLDIAVETEGNRVVLIVVYENGMGTKLYAPPRQAIALAQNLRAAANKIRWGGRR